MADLELKDVILSTLDEIEKDGSKKDDVNLKKHIESYQENAYQSQNGQNQNVEDDELDTPPFLRNQESIAPQEKQQPQESTSQAVTQDTKKVKSNEDEIKYLENIREKMLVLFEGFQSPNNKNIEAKLDLTINFLEYILSTLDERLDKLKKE